MRCLYSVSNSTGEGYCLTGTKLGDGGWRCLLSVDGNRKTRGEGEREREKREKGRLKSIRSSETLWIS